MKEFLHKLSALIDFSLQEKLNLFSSLVRIYQEVYLNSTLLIIIHIITGISI